MTAVGEDYCGQTKARTDVEGKVSLPVQFGSAVRISVQLAKPVSELMLCEDRLWGGAHAPPMPAVTVRRERVGRAGGTTNLGVIELAQMASELMPSTVPSAMPEDGS